MKDIIAINPYDNHPENAALRKINFCIYTYFFLQVINLPVLNVMEKKM